MSWRNRARRTGTALVIMGLVLSTVDVNPAGEIRGAFADEPNAAAANASPKPNAPPEPAVSAEPTLASPTAAASPPETAVASTEGVAVGAPPKAPEGGDLTHLVFTATDGLVASLVDPVDDDVASSVSASVEVETIRGAGVELRVGDAVVPFSRIGRRTVDAKTGATRYTYYGVTLQPGPNIVTLTPLGGANARGEATVHRIYAPGRPAKLALTGSGAFRADGTSADRLQIEGHDAWGHRAAPGSVVHVTLMQGDAHLERTSQAGPAAAPNAPTPVPLASASPGIVAASVIRQAVDVVLDADGEATLRLVPGITPGAVVLRAECGEANREARFFLAPNLRKPFVSGLVTAGAGAVPGIPDEDPGEPDGTNSRRGRIALFATGAVGKSLATFAYDTADTLQRSSEYGGALGTYQGDPDDKPYDTTGDTSLRRDDALSRDHLFARIDNGQSTAEWGEFRARTGDDTNTLGAFDQLVDGAKVELGNGTGHATMFAARNDVGYDRRVFAPTGLANGVILRPDIVVGSEVVTLAALDPRSGAIITQTAMTRGVDYSIEYATGQLSFIDIPLPLNEAFDPQEIVVTYEFDSPGNTARTIGGRAETSFGPNQALKLGFGYVNDTSGAGNIALATEDLNGTIPGGSWQIAHATSHGALLATSPDAPIAGDGGNALHAQLTRAAGSDRLSVLYDRTDGGYYDPFGGLATPGLLNEHLTYAHKYAAGQGETAIDFSHQANAGVGIPGSTETTATLRSNRTLSKRVTVNASLQRSIATTSGGPAFGPQTVNLPSPGATPIPITLDGLTPYVPLTNQSSTQASMGVDWKATSTVDLSVNRVQTLTGENDVQPTQTDAQLTYDLGKGGRAYLRERWSASPIESFAASTQAITAATGGMRTTEIGLSRPLGGATTVDTSYLVDHTLNGDDVYAAMGIRERLSLGSLKGDAFVQHATAIGDAGDTSTVSSAGGVTSTSTGGGGFDLYGLSLSYADPANKFRASGSAQMRTGDGAGVSISLAATGALSPDLSAFASVNDARAAGADQADERVGLAWRPSRSDVGVTLLQFERTDGTAVIDNTEGGVLSLEQVLRVRERTEVVARYAYKVDGDAFYAARSSLAELRVDQQIGSRLDVGAEVRRADVRGIDGASGTATAVEGGVRLGDSMRLGVGYNLSGTADPSLSTTPTHRGFYTTVTAVVDRLFGWGRR
jgi:hypothetical protein